MRNILICFLALYSNLLYGQAALFEPGIITNNQEFGLAISPDGKDLLFVKAYGGRDSMRIFQSKRLNEKWQEPQPAFFSSKGTNQIDPSFSPDGSMILINAIKPQRTDYDVFVITRTLSGWKELESLSNAINTKSHEFYATMSNNKNIYFTRRLKSNDLYVSYWDNNEYQKAIALGSTINTDKSESNPYISPKEDFIIFVSERPEGYGGGDLYISFNKQGKWSFPINMGNKINSILSEFCPSIDLKNQYFLFARTQIEDNKRIENIYSFPLKELKIKKLKKLAKWDK